MRPTGLTNFREAAEFRVRGGYHVNFYAKKLNRKCAPHAATDIEQVMAISER